MWLTADEAVAVLSVKKSTLYTYASRGWLRTRRAGRQRWYHAEDVDELARRAAAAGGHAAAASSALHWGAPVLDSAVSSIDLDGPNYRGVPAVWLAERDTPFEAVATLLWDGTLPDPAPRLSPWAFDPGDSDRGSRRVPDGAPVGRTLLAIAATLGFRSGARALAPIERDALGLIHRLCAWAASAVGPRATWVERAAAAAQASSVAEALAAAMGEPSAARWVDRALVLCAEHELNASSFAARIAASTGADRAAVLCAALAVWTGPEHGGASERLEEVLDGQRTIASLGGAGFGHRLYPAGDPRAERLLADARALGGDRLAPVERLLAEAALAGRPPPNLDAGLVALAAALGLPRGAGALMFAVGRTAGWIAHAEEQRASGRLLRPRARYVAVEPPARTR